MGIKDILGAYAVTGTNQDDSKNAYKGTLELSVDSNNSIQAKWLINNNQMQRGVGIFKDNILEITFKYENKDNQTFSGVVVYTCLTKNLLEGFWFEEFGNPNFLGSERCFRISNRKTQLD